MGRAIYFSGRRGTLGDEFQLNGWIIAFVNNNKYHGVIFNRRMT
jgi:hypothetical protein